jgi:hypothetical protein
MKAWCAWCQEEGRPGFLGDRPPLDDPSDTHGICDHHRAMLLAALPQNPAAAPTRPLRRMLLVLDPEAVELYQYLTRSFAGLKGVEVILDRRRRQSREEPEPAVPPVPNRRVHQGERHPVGYTIVRLPPHGDG